ncbi:RES family NAD+ phosphorylase [Erwinia sp. SLM-02]|uniref:RES family NAD+ phosphorylase n=1 Tax=Erwinia sp. SLM-02 TaxID=3020057 RepID=UPI0028D6F5C3|nr:RES family NAD+ phosphorylase [uncultured Erwinia sp.]
MILYRLTKTRFAAGAWSGQGAKEAGGRWNSVGTAMVYAAEAASLTMLETLVHLHAANLLDSFTLLSIDVDDELIQMIDNQILPANWAAAEAPLELAEIGDRWVESGDAVALRVPSALSPVEFNFLLNPRHPQFLSVVSRAVKIDFQFDSRLK